MTDDRPDLSIVLPVKDGEVRLLETLEQVDELVQRLGESRQCPRRTEVLAVDDGSEDRTAEILRDFAARKPYMRVLTHAENRGKGAALKTAAAASRGFYLLCVDADATYSLDVVENFLAALEGGSGAAIGNRRDRATQFVLHPRDFAYIGRRHAVGWFHGLMARTLTGVPVQDFQAGFKAYRGDVARELFAQVEDDRFAFDTEILGLLHHHGHEIAQLPIVYIYRHQPSAVRLVRDGLRMLQRLFQLRSRLRRMKRSGVFVDHTRGDYQRLAREEGHPIQRFWHQKKWPLIDEFLELEPGQRVLDVGAGSSEVSERMAERAGLTCATDFSAKPLDFLSTQDELHLSLVGADLRALPFRDASFDRVVVLEVIEHVPFEDMQRYFSELLRLLKPGGRLMLSTPNYRSTWPVLEWLVDHFGGAAEMGGKQHIARFHARSLRAALLAHGFELRRFGSVYHLSPFIAPLFPRLAERLFRWEMHRGGTWGPILFAVAEARE